MAKKIIVCMDGTTNKPADRTNVYQICKEGIQDYDKQVPRYIEGIASTKHKLRNLKEAMTGIGISEQILEAYREIVAHYKKNQGSSQVWLFGFSRGAYAARSLSGFLYFVGVLREQSIQEYYQHNKRDLIEDAYTYYRLPNNEGSWYEKRVRQKYYGYTHRGAMMVLDHNRDVVNFSAVLEVAKDSKYRDHYQDTDLGIRVEFLGVWDSVGSLGSPTPALRYLSRPLHAFHDVSISPNVTHGFHALALHEIRLHFEPDIWLKAHPSNHTVMQKWFTGSHSNVGGNDHNRDLSDTALYWMVDKAMDYGLEFEPDFLERKYRFEPDYARPIEISWILMPIVRIRKAITYDRTELSDQVLRQVFRHESVRLTVERKQTNLEKILIYKKKIDQLAIENLKERQSVIDELVNEIFQSIQRPGSMDKSYVLYDDFAGSDLMLQQSRVDLITQIENILDSGLNELSKDAVSALVVSQHNTALGYHIDSQNVSRHIEEIEEMYNHLRSKLLRLTSNQYISDVAFSLDIMKHNMRCIISDSRNI